jgi:hypothetical protein
VVSATNPHGRNLDFLDRSRYFFLTTCSSIVLRRLSGPRPDPLLLRKSGSAGNRARISGSVARNSDNWTTEAVCHSRSASIFPVSSIRTLRLVMGIPRRNRWLAAIFYSRQPGTRRQRNARRVAAVLADRGRDPGTDLTVIF